MNNLVVQLLLKTGTFSTDLKTARGQIQNFQQGCQTAGRSLSGFSQALGINVGALTKFGGAVGAAVAAGKGLKAVIESNQTYSDKFAETMYSCKNAVSEFAYAIGTFDFSNFNNGLLDMIRRGRDAAAAIDQLGNTLMSYNIVRAEAELRISKARSVIRNPKSTPAEKEAAQKEMESAMSDLRSSTGVLIDDYKDTIVSEVRAKGLELSGDDSLSIIDKWLKMDAKVGREKAKTTAEEGYNAYLSELSKLNNKKEYQTWQTLGTSITGYTMGGWTTDTSNPEYQKELSALRNRYQDEIAYNVLLEKYNDKALDQLGQRRVAMINTEKTLEDLTTSMYKVEKAGGNATTSTTKGLNNEIDVMETSLTYWENIKNEALKHRNAEVFNSKSWNDYNKAMEIAIEKIDEINLKTKVAEQRQKMDELGTLPELPKIEGKVEIGPDPKTVKYTATELDHLIKLYTQWREELEEGDPLIAKYNQKIKEYGDRLNAINSTGLPEPSIKKETINTWDEFNSAMADTSTIVSSLSNTFKESSEVTVASILQMVSTTLPAIGSLISSIQALSAAEAVEAGVAATGKAVSTSKHWIEAIAAVAALGAAVATAISAAQKPQRFANGGIVGGSSFTGDRVTAQVNSGEMILNKTQQARLFQLANGSAAEGREVNFRISGTDLVGVLNNQTRKNRLIR